jgi:hypothetical protein
VKASEHSSHDGCDATFFCPGARTIQVSCDGENDGTMTSLCDCQEGERRAAPSAPVPGEAPDSCLAGVDYCLQALQQAG